MNAELNVLDLHTFELVKEMSSENPLDVLESTDQHWGYSTFRVCAHVES